MRHVRVSKRRDLATNLMRLGTALMLAILGLFIGTMLAQQSQPEPVRNTFQKISPPPPAKSVGVIEGRHCLDYNGPCVAYFSDES